jgi:hypothetical protein
MLSRLDLLILGSDPFKATEPCLIIGLYKAIHGYAGPTVGEAVNPSCSPARPKRAGVTNVCPDLSQVAVGPKSVAIPEPILVMAILRDDMGMPLAFSDYARGHF